jgi:hypothetical protein
VTSTFLLGLGPGFFLGVPSFLSGTASLATFFAAFFFTSVFCLEAGVEAAEGAIFPCYSQDGGMDSERTYI